MNGSYNHLGSTLGLNFFPYAIGEKMQISCSRIYILIFFREEIQIVWDFFPKVNQYIRLHEIKLFFSYGVGEEIQIPLNGHEAKEFITGSETEYNPLECK